MRVTRRQFVRTAAVGGAGVLGLDGLGFLGRLPSVGAGEAKLNPRLVRLDDSIEPLVRVLEETPRPRLLEEVAGRIRGGLSYRELLAALLLAGVRNVQPRPTVGFKFHAVLVVNSAHLASLSSPDADRWLPIFWALDYFKSAQAATAEESGWRMGPVDESKVPPASKAGEAFTRAMDAWDEAAADAAAAGLARGTHRGEAFERFAAVAARDFRDIGHKTIYVANSFRTLDCIGWHHAEPVLRSLAYALLRHEGKNPATSDLPPDRPWQRNAERAAKLRPDWRDGQPDAKGTSDLLAVLRAGSDDDAAAAVVDLLNRGVSPQSAWDALLCGAGELLMRRPGIIALHAVTMSNAMRYCFEATASDSTRRRLLLQNAAFLPMFRAALGGKVADVPIDRMEGAAPADEKPLAEIFAEADRDRPAAARKTLGYLARQGPAGAKDLIDAARRLIFLKGSNSHDYKFSSAVFEDYHHLSPAWRDRFLASSLFYLRGSGSRDTDLVQRTRAALGA